MADADPHDLSDAHTALPRLTGRKAVITGGTTGIGRAIAVLLASEGVEVFTCGRDQQHLADSLARINEVGKGGGIALDLADTDGVERFFAVAEDALGSYDIAVINAAVPAQGLTEMDGDAVRYAIAADFTAYVMSAHHAAAHLKDKGDIILIGSMTAHVLGPHSTVYAGAKAGIAGFAEALRKELGDKGIRVGLVEPALTGSDMQLPDIPPAKQRAMIHADKMLRAEDIAVGVHYMLSQPRRVVVQQLTITQRVSDED